MKSPVSRYFTGYVIRFVIGTVFVLTAISAVRIIFFSDRVSAAGTVWEKSLEYPDRLVMAALERYAPRYLPGKNEIDSAPPAMQTVTAPDAPGSAASQAYSDSDNADAGAGNSSANGSCPLPHMPSMPNMNNSDASSSCPVPGPPDAATPGSEEWGLTANNTTPVYSLKGKRITKLSAGKIFMVVEHKRTPKGEFIICALPNKPSVRFVLRPQDAVIYNCNYNATTPEQRQLCRKQAKIMAAIDERKKQIDDQMEGRNPYAERYHKDLAKYKAMAKRNNALLKAYKTATGPRRMEIADKLRIIKEDSAHATDSYHSIKQQYNDWKNQHAGNSPDYDNDSQIRRLKQALMEVEHQLANP